MRAATLLPLVVAGLLVTDAALAGPLFDPFLERFQVGFYGDPQSIELVEGFPADLLEPAVVDREWLAAANEVLANPDADLLVLRLARAVLGPEATRAWLNRERRPLDYLTGDSDDLTGGVSPGAFLAEEVLSQRFFAELAADRSEEALEIARSLAGESTEPRRAFVWQLRAELLAARTPDAGGEAFWATMYDLPPYDSQSAWALWIAHRRAIAADELPPVVCTEQGERFLSGLARGWFSPQTLYASRFEPEAQAALGAQLFGKGDLAAHMKRFPDPPRDFRRQGLWVKGARFARRGQAAAYERLAARDDLHPGWRMDVWRRASELRFLAGSTAAGLKDLENALAIAARSEGTLPLRRRLRQWSEQALVLALARSDTALAAWIHGMARDSFFEEEAEAFGAETGYWLPALDLKEDDVRPPEIGRADELGRARRVVESGAARSCRKPDGESAGNLSRAADRPLWKEWAGWGIGLAGAKGLSAERQVAADAYRDTLTAALRRAEETGSDKSLVDAALSCVAMRHSESGIAAELLDEALRRGIAAANGWRTPQGASIVPKLVVRSRGSQLDRHALLGFALAERDLRGILAAAVELPARGITAAQKLRFLYPLPGPGPIRDALSGQPVEPALLLAIARNESLFDPTVRSRAGALGFMQIMPFHYEGRGALPGKGHWARPAVSIEKGARILAENRRRYDGDSYLAVAAYNAGPGAADRWLDQLDGHPDRDLYLAWIGYPETRRYVEKVLMDRRIYDWIIAADSGD